MRGGPRGEADSGDAAGGAHPPRGCPEAAPQQGRGLGSSLPGPAPSTQPPDAAEANSFPKDFTMRFFAYIVGFLILIGGLAWAAIEAGAPQLYVMIGSVILLGLG